MNGDKNGDYISRVTVVAVTSVLLCFYFLIPLKAEVWYLPDGQTITTQAGSTPPVSGARRVPYPNAKQVQTDPASLPATVTPAPSTAQLQALLPQAVEVEAPIKTSPDFAKATVGDRGGQCAAFAESARPELMRYGPYGSANKMPDKARASGFEVNGIPRVGSVLIIAKPLGSTDGHAEVVTDVLKDGDRYILTVMDSNAGKDERISERTVYYTPAENGSFGNYGRYEEAIPGLTKLADNLIVMGFIQKNTNTETK